jgi:Flp pilus assembly protein TadB
MDTATRDYPAGDIRVSDADRDRALSELSEHFETGRLTSDELDERSGQVLRARTGRELRALLSDLPRKEVPGTHPAAGQAEPRLPSRLPFAPIFVVVFALALLATVHGHPGVLVVPVILAVLIFRRVTCGLRGPRQRRF